MDNNNLVGSNFELNVDNFETLIGAFTSKEDLLIIFDVSHTQMDKFCCKHYKRMFNDTYSLLSAKAYSLAKMSILKLANMGHHTAMNIASKYIMKMEEEKSQNSSKIPIIGVMQVPIPSEDNAIVDGGVRVEKKRKDK